MGSRLVPAGERLGAPLARPSKIVCIGLNYIDHAREAGLEPPEQPVVFSSRPHQPLLAPTTTSLFPKGSKATDWEVELGIVIGARASYVSESDALDSCGWLRVAQ